MLNKLVGYWQRGRRGSNSHYVSEIFRSIRAPTRRPVTIVPRTFVIPIPAQFMRLRFIHVPASLLNLFQLKLLLWHSVTNIWQFVSNQSLIYLDLSPRPHDRDKCHALLPSRIFPRGPCRVVSALDLRNVSFEHMFDVVCLAVYQSIPVGWCFICKGSQIDEEVSDLLVGVLRLWTWTVSSCKL